MKSSGVAKNVFLDGKMKILKHIKFFGIILMFGTTLTFLKVFLTAYLDPAKQVLVTINQYGEANFEMFVLFPCVLVLGTIAAVLAFMDWIKKEKV